MAAKVSAAKLPELSKMQASNPAEQLDAAQPPTVPAANANVAAIVSGTGSEANTNAEQSSPGKGKREGGGGGRKRKRHIYNSIRAQMEFYFGDSNLSKDRFLRRYVDQDPYVPLDVFLSFNKIKALTQDVEQIAKALSNSQLLQLDESGQKVRRKTALPENFDVADRTLYVEALPATASHEWLKKVFSRYGPVAYVSLPHFPLSRKIKEFAFIEFERKASVEKAIKAFTQIQGVLSMEHTDPANLASVRSFQKQQQQEQQQQSKSGDESEPTATTTPAEPQRKGAVKREGSGEENEPEVEAVPTKRIKLDTSEVAVDEADNSSDSPSEQSGSEPESDNDDENEDEEDGEAEAKTAGDGAAEEGGAESGGENSKKRRRKRKKKAAQGIPNIDPTAFELKVMPKPIWSGLRNKYLNLQRRMVNEAKTKLWLQGQQQHNPQPQQKRTPKDHVQQLAESKANNSGASSEGHEENEPLSDNGDPAAPIPPKRRKRNKQGGNSGGGGGVHKMNMNFYGAGGNEADDNKSMPKSENQEQERTPLFKYEPGLIVECILHEPCTSVKEFKADMRQYTDIKYTDIKEGAEVAHLRLSTPQAAEELVRKLSCAEMKLKVLRGQPESKYWRKIEEDREAKLSKQVRVKQKRGREKVAKLLAKHIKFDDNEEEANDAGVGSGDA